MNYELFTENHFGEFAIGTKVVIQDSVAFSPNDFGHHWVLGMTGEIVNKMNERFIVKIESYKRIDGFLKGEFKSVNIPERIYECFNVNKC